MNVEQFSTYILCKKSFAEAMEGMIFPEGQTLKSMKVVANMTFAETLEISEGKEAFMMDTTLFWTFKGYGAITTAPGYYPGFQPWNSKGEDGHAVKEPVYNGDRLVLVKSEEAGSIVFELVIE